MVELVKSLEHVFKSDQTRQRGTQRKALPHRRVQPRFNPRERFLRVSAFFFRVITHIYIWDIFLSRFWPVRWYVRRSAKQRWVMIARRFRALAIEMGGIQIKLGQYLSTRADLIMQEVRHELAGLQDEVPAAPVEQIIDLIVEELGGQPADLFARFDEQTVAAASLGQVHYATLRDGREVAIKVQRPHIQEIVEVDLSALAWVVKVIKNYEPIRRSADLQALFKEFSRVLHEELDYVQEARNAELFRANFAEVPGVYVPEPVFEMTTRRVMVMERISGIKISDLDALDAAGINRHELAERLNETYLKQFFLDGFFHADPHPGNLFVRVEPSLPITAYTNGNAPPIRKPAFASKHDALVDEMPTSGTTPFTLIFIDFGMVGHLSPDAMEHMRNGVVGLATNDAERIVEALDRIGVILPGADKRPIIMAVQVMMRHVYNRSVRELNSIDVEAIFDETKDVIYNLPFQLPQDMLYLGRALSLVSGLATTIEPDINLFASLQPFARMMLDREQQKSDWVGDMQHELRELAQILVTLPRNMDSYYKSANRGELKTRTDFSRLERTMRRVEHSNDRLTGGMLATGLFLGGVQLRAQGREQEANRAWAAAAAALLWSFRPRGDGR